jgi:YD repeat-containing protein
MVWNRDGKEEGSPSNRKIVVPGGGGEKLTSLTDAVGSTTSFAYDLRGLLTTITDPLQLQL